jgi:DNA (cytosine-5)-methyltransferase 1
MSSIRPLLKVPAMTMPDPSTRDLVLELRRRYTQSDLAKKMGSTLRTVRRWESGESMGSAYLRDSLRHLLNASTKPGDFTFADVFAGIGGTRLAFEEVEGVKGRCVFTAEWNKFAVQSYCENFGHDDEHVFAEDITKVSAQDIPDHDVLLAGFPCQPFSIAGVSKKNALGRPHGFQDATQGTLFFDVARIIDEKKPQAFMLENVKNLLSHDRGNTFRVIERTLTVSSVKQCPSDGHDDIVATRAGRLVRRQRVTPCLSRARWGGVPTVQVHA